MRKAASSTTRKSSISSRRIAHAGRPAETANAHPALACRRSLRCTPARTDREIDPEWMPGHRSTFHSKSLESPSAPSLTVRNAVTEQAAVAFPVRGAERERGTPSDVSAGLHLFDFNPAEERGWQNRSVQRKLQPLRFRRGEHAFSHIRRWASPQGRSQFIPRRRRE